MSALTCPHCRYSGGVNYALRPGFKYAELIWAYYDVQPKDGHLELAASSLNTDPEQEARERKIECGGCGEFFALPDGFTWDWV